MGSVKKLLIFVSLLSLLSYGDEPASKTNQSPFVPSANTPSPLKKALNSVEEALRSFSNTPETFIPIERSPEGIERIKKEIFQNENQTADHLQKEKDFENKDPKKASFHKKQVTELLLKRATLYERVGNFSLALYHVLLAKDRGAVFDADHILNRLFQNGEALPKIADKWRVLGSWERALRNVREVGARTGYEKVALEFITEYLPDKAETRRVRGEIRERLGDKDLALAHRENSIKKHLSLAEKFENENKLEKVSYHFKEVADIFIEIARSYEKEKNMEMFFSYAAKAIQIHLDKEKSFEESKELSSIHRVEATNIILEQGKAYEKEGNMEMALTYIVEARDRGHPLGEMALDALFQNEKALLEIGAKWEVLGSWDRALDNFLKVFDKDSPNHKDITSLILSLIAELPETPRTQEALARIHEGLKNVELVLFHLEKVVELHMESLEKENQPDKKDLHQKEAIKFLLEIIEIHEKEGNFSEALKFATKAKELGSEEVERFLDKLFQNEKALMEVAVRWPILESSERALDNFLVLRESPGKEKFILTLMDYLPNTARIEGVRGEIHEKLGDINLALDHKEKSLTLHLEEEKKLEKEKPLKSSYHGTEARKLIMEKVQLYADLKDFEKSFVEIKRARSYGINEVERFLDSLFQKPEHLSLIFKEWRILETWERALKNIQVASKNPGSEKIILKALEELPPNSLVNLEIGRAYAKLQNPIQALAYFKMSDNKEALVEIEKVSQTTEVIYDMAEKFEWTGDFKKAFENHFKLAMEKRDPKSLLPVIIMLYQGLGVEKDQERALKLYNSYLKLIYKKPQWMLTHNPLVPSLEQLSKHVLSVKESQGETTISKCLSSFKPNSPLHNSLPNPLPKSLTEGI